MKQQVNGHSRIRFIGGTYHINKAYFSGLCKGIYPQNMAWNMVQYLHFRILEFPLKQGIGWFVPLRTGYHQISSLTINLPWLGLSAFCLKHTTMEQFWYCWICATCYIAILGLYWIIYHNWIALSSIFCMVFCNVHHHFDHGTCHFGWHCRENFAKWQESAATPPRDIDSSGSLDGWYIIFLSK